MPLSTPGRRPFLQFPERVTSRKLQVQYSNHLSRGYINTRNSLSLIKEWLDVCFNSHAECRRRGYQLPARPIYVGDSHPKLCLTSELGVLRPKYAALSYCWGRKKLFKWTSHRLPSFQTETPPGALPRSFENAISTARYLGIDYLWIDSLCIIEDSEEDWSEQSAIMPSIYGNAFFTIAASGAEDDTQGFFF